MLNDDSLGGLFSRTPNCVENVKKIAVSQINDIVDAALDTATHAAPTSTRMTFDEIIRFGVVRGMKYHLHMDIGEIHKRTGESIDDIVEWCRNDTGRTNEK